MSHLECGYFDTPKEGNVDEILWISQNQYQRVASGSGTH